MPIKATVHHQQPRKVLIMTDRYKRKKKTEDGLSERLFFIDINVGVSDSVIKRFEGKGSWKPVKLFPNSSSSHGNTVYGTTFSSPHSHEFPTCDQYHRMILSCFFLLPSSLVWNALPLFHMSHEPDQSCILCYCFHFYREDFSSW